MKKILAIQQAAQATGMVYYVTKDNELKQSFNLLGAKIEYKIYSDGKKVIIEDETGRTVETVSLSQELRNITTEEVHTDVKPKRSKTPANK